MKIVVDIFGGDNAPAEVLKGCAAALAADKDLRLIMVGKADVINSYAASARLDFSRIEVLDALDVVTNEDAPAQVIRAKPDSSMIKALRVLKENPDATGFVSAGSTGAALTGATLLVGRIKGIHRPALAPVMPTINRKNVIMLDIGANMDCKPEFLQQFGTMGSAYMKAVFGIEKPRIALLSVGTEDKKGNELNHAAFDLLKQTSLNFVGNMEARDVFSGDYDVIVCDGFYGNIALKMMEGTFHMYTDVLKQEIKASLCATFGYLFMRKAFKKLKKRLDYTAMGGASFLGCEKVIIKAHGSSTAPSICASILKAKMMAENKTVEIIKAELANIIG